jgi:hypothetical protein
MDHLDLTELAARASFDVVFAHELLQHIPADRRVDTLSRMRHAMRADGRLVLVFHTSNRVEGDAVAAYWPKRSGSASAAATTARALTSVRSREHFC